MIDIHSHLEKGSGQTKEWCEDDFLGRTGRTQSTSLVLTPPPPPAHNRSDQTRTQQSLYIKTGLVIRFGLVRPAEARRAEESPSRAAARRAGLRGIQ